MKKRYIIFLVILITFLIYIKIDVIGFIMPVDNILILNTYYNGDYLHLEGGYYIDSITVFSGYSYRIENNKLYIKMRKANASFWHPIDSFNIEINVKGKDISEVYLEDNKGNEKLIFLLS